MLSLFLHRISVVHVNLSIAATTHGSHRPGSASPGVIGEHRDGGTCPRGWVGYWWVREISLVGLSCTATNLTCHNGHHCHKLGLRVLSCSLTTDHSIGLLYKFLQLPLCGEFGFSSGVCRLRHRRRWCQSQPLHLGFQLAHRVHDNVSLLAQAPRGDDLHLLERYKCVLCSTLMLDPGPSTQQCLNPSKIPNLQVLLWPPMMLLCCS